MKKLLNNKVRYAIKDEKDIVHILMMESCFGEDLIFEWSNDETSIYELRKDYKNGFYYVSKPNTEKT